MVDRKEFGAEVILQMSIYGGMPVCIEGLIIDKEIFEKKSTTSKND
jgi:alkylhydroperoxidase/carboxymuconolactone decarboxylase family protein YurZ